MNRDCKKCVHHISGECSAWTCEMQTLEDYKAKVIDEYMNSLGEHCMEQENDCSNLECPFCTDGCDIINIAERLKAGDNNE